MSAPKPRGWAERNQLLAKVHIAKKQLGWDDDTYRDVMERMFKVRTAGKLTPIQLVQLIEHMASVGFDSRKRVRSVGGASVSHETGKRPNADVVAKMRAQWLALYNIGAVKRPQDLALLEFVRKQTATANGGRGVAKLEWVKPDEAFRVVEALKSWGAREGIKWDAYADPRLCVIDRQAEIMVELKMFQYPTQVAAMSFSMMGASDWKKLSRDQLVDLMNVLGSQIRLAKLKGQS